MFLEHNQIVALGANSGVGKTSFLQAGLFPALVANGRVPVILRNWSRVDENPRGDNAYRDAVLAAFRSDASRDLYGSSLERDDVFPEGLIEAGQFARSQALFAEATQRLESASGGDAPLKPRAVMQILRETMGKKLVIVFDQFEELLRSDDERARLILSTIVTASRSFPFKHIISLRGEYAGELRDFEGNASRYHYFKLRAFEDKPAEEARSAINEVILKPAKMAGIKIQPGVVQEIENWWMEVFSPGQNGATGIPLEQDLRRSKTGLLQLQALLWGLGRAAERDPRPGANAAESRDGSTRVLSIGRRVWSDYRQQVNTYRPQEVDSLSSNIATQQQVLSDFALRTYIDEMLDSTRLEHRLRDAGGVEELADRAMSMRSLAARILPNLSSGGYKIALSAPDLFRRTISDILDGPNELASKRLSGEPTPPPHLGSSSGRSTGATLHDGRTNHFEEIEISSYLARHGSTGVAAQDDEAVWLFNQTLFELKAANLVSVIDHSGGTQVTLVHDGFADAMRSWSMGASAHVQADISWPFAATNRRFVFPGSVVLPGRKATSELVWSNDIADVRWWGCRIGPPDRAASEAGEFRAVFKDMSFIAADLRGLILNDCRFEGDVRFDGCCLNGLLVRNCEIAPRSTVTITGGEAVALSFHGLTGPGTLNFDQVVVRSLFISARAGLQLRLDRANVQGAELYSESPSEREFASLELMDSVLARALVGPGSPERITADNSSLIFCDFVDEPPSAKRTPRSRFVLREGVKVIGGRYPKSSGLQVDLDRATHVGYSSEFPENARLGGPKPVQPWDGILEGH